MGICMCWSGRHFVFGKIVVFSLWLSAKASSRNSGMTALSKEQEPKDEISVEEKQRKKRIQTMIPAILFQSVMHHVLILQSDIIQMKSACGDDAGKTSVMLGKCTLYQGLITLFLNQIGGKLSDSLGRKLFFQVGPACNILLAGLLFKNPHRVWANALYRVFAHACLSFSGSVMTTASVWDTLTPSENTGLGARNVGAIGMAVVFAPYLESMLLKLTNGQTKYTYLATILLSLIQISTNAMFLPETLPVAKRKSIDDFKNSLSSFNPLAFVQLKNVKSKLLKQVFVIGAFQLFLEGKCTSDLCQLWCRTDAKMSNEQIRDFIAVWGFANIASGCFRPQILKTMSATKFTTLANLTLALGVATHGIAPKGKFMWAPLPLMLLGLNCGHNAALGPLIGPLASEEGLPKGEVAAWMQNLRAVVTTVAPLSYGLWYAACKRNNKYTGSTWWLAAAMGALLPELLLRAMPADERAALDRKASA